MEDIEVIKKYTCECLACKKIFGVTIDHEPVMCDVCGSADIRILHSEKIDQPEDPRKQFRHSARIFRKAYEKGVKKLDRSNKP